MKNEQFVISFKQFVGLLLYNDTFDAIRALKWDSDSVCIIVALF